MIKIKMMDEVTGEEASREGPDFDGVFNTFYERLLLDKRDPALQAMKEECRLEVAEGRLYSKTVAFGDHILTVTARPPGVRKSLAVYTINGEDVRYDHQWDIDPVRYARQHGRAVMVFKDSTVVVFRRLGPPSKRQKAIIR